MKAIFFSDTEYRTHTCKACQKKSTPNNIPFRLLLEGKGFS